MWSKSTLGYLNTLVILSNTTDVVPIMECRFFHTGNVGSLSQRAAKLIAVKVRVLKKKSAALAIPADLCASAFGSGSNPGAVESFSKFDSRQL